jgi:hypothetical protein
VRHSDIEQYKDQEVDITLSSGAVLTGHYKDNNDGTISFWTATPAHATPQHLTLDKPIERGAGFKFLYATITSMRPAKGS